MTIISTIISRYYTVHASDSLLTQTKVTGEKEPIEWEKTKIIKVDALVIANGFGTILSYLFQALRGINTHMTTMDTTNKSEVFTWILSGISLVADVIAIIGVINIKQASTSVHLSPGFAFGIWILGLYTYFGFLHSYWKRRVKTINNNSFGHWFFQELLLNFEEPKLLFPFVLFIILLFSIANAISVGLAIILSIVLFVISLLLFVTKVESPSSLTKKELSEEQKKEIDDEWQFWERRIKTELEGKMWITANDFKDISITKQLGKNSFEYIFAKYVSKHPRKFRYGDVIDIEEEKRVVYHFEAKVALNALVNLDTFDDRRFYVE